MRLNFVFIAIIFNISANVYAQNTAKYLARAERNKKLGCLDTTGKEVVPIKYDDIGFWGNNLIPVNAGAKEIDYLKTGGKWGYCNAEGRLAIPLQFQKAESFHEGLAAVKLNNKWGFIDTSGKMVIPCKFNSVRLFKNGMCAVETNNKWGYIDRKGIEKIKPTYGAASEFNQGVASVFVGTESNEEEGDPKGDYCLINLDGKKITPAKYEMIWNFKDGLARVEVPDKDDKYSTKKGFVNVAGQEVIPAVYDDAKDFNDGLAAIGIKNAQTNDPGFSSNYTYGYINAKGEEVIKPQFSRTDGFVAGKAIVSKGRQRRMGFIDVNPQDMSIINYAEWPNFGLIDTLGNYILDTTWGTLAFIDINLLIARRYKYYGDGVITTSGQTVIPFKYTNLKYAGNKIFTADMPDKKADGEVVLDVTGKVLLTTTKYKMPASTYQFGLLSVCTGNLKKSGFIDLKGNLVIEDKYDMVWNFETTNP